MAEASLVDVPGLNAKDLYSCTSCSSKIPDSKARILCQKCLNYHLCANCYVIKNYAKPHVDSHPTMVLKLSGYFVPGAPGFTPKPTPALPPRPSVAAPSVKDTVEIPTADWGLLWSMMKAPLQKKGRIQLKDDPKELKTIEIKDVTGLGMSGGLGNMPPSPPRSVDLLDSAAPSYPMPEKWEPLFGPDSTPTPVFIALMSTIFSHLDPRHTGYLEPETYSDFLDTQGYQWTANVWKNALDSENSENHKDVADLEFGIYLSEMSISHAYQVRPKASPTDPSHTQEPNSPDESRAIENLNFGANMPMLTRQGFIDLSAIEYLVNPAKGHAYLQKATSEYQVWTGLGEIPRNVLPDNSLPKASQMKAKAVEEGVKMTEDNEAKAAPPPLPLRTNSQKIEEPVVPKDEFHEVDLELKEKEWQSGKESMEEIREAQVANGKLAAKIAEADDEQHSGSESGKSFKDLYKK